MTFSYSLKVQTFADDNTLFAFDKTFDEVTKKTQNDFLILDEWFFNNFHVLNSGKCHFMTLGTPNTYLTLNLKILQSRTVSPKNC